MPAEIDGTKAVYARKPAWHRIGTVKEEGWFTAEEAIAVLNPTGEPIRKGKVTITILDGDGNEVVVPFPEKSGVVDFDHESGKFRPLSVMDKDYGLMQREQQFTFVDEVIGQVNGAHYEAAVNLRNGKQTCLTAYLGDFVLDPNGIADKNKKFLWSFNSWDGSWALRLKFGNFRVECANMAAMALRGSTDKNVMGSEWSTRHTANISSRVSEAAAVLGLWHDYEVVYEAQAEHMIHVPLLDNTFQRVIDGLFTAENPKTGQVETDREAAEQVRTIYELSASQRDIFETVWGGFNAAVEYHDWATKVRGSKSTSVSERRFLRQVEDPTGFKQQAWDRFWNVATDNKPFDMDRAKVAV